jgi:hypothetical protein
MKFESLEIVREQWFVQPMHKSNIVFANHFSNFTFPCVALTVDRVSCKWQSLLVRMVISSGMTGLSILCGQPYVI